MIIVPGLPRIRANARVAAHWRMPVRLHQEARSESGWHAQRQRPVHCVRHQLRAVPIRTKRHGDRSILSMQPQLAAVAGEADRPILRGNVRLARAILHADRPVRGTRRDLSVHGVKTNRTVMRCHFDIRRPRRSNQQVHSPVPALALRPAYRNLAALHCEFNLRQKPRRIAAHRRLASRHRVHIFIPPLHLHPAAFNLVHPQDPTFSFTHHPFFAFNPAPHAPHPHSHSPPSPPHPPPPHPPPPNS